MRRRSLTTALPPQAEIPHAYEIDPVPRRMTMDQAKVVEAARLLVEARRTGRPIKELPQEVRPVVAADSNAIVNEITKMLGEEVAGWKITFLYKPREIPVQCQLFASRVFASPAKIPLSL